MMLFSFLTPRRIGRVTAALTLLSASLSFCAFAEDSLKTLQQQAEQGDPVAQYQLALKYRHGKGVEQNNARAVEWYQKAAEQGNVNAQYNLALMYRKGRA